MCSALSAQYKNTNIKVILTANTTKEKYKKNQDNYVVYFWSKNNL